jgi:hypothetical protein
MLWLGVLEVTLMGGLVRLAELADKVVGAEPRFDATGQRVAVALYRMLGEGAPVAIGRLAAALSIPEDTIVVSFLTPNRRFDQNVIESFCHFVHFFQTSQAGDEWTGRHPGTFLLSVEEAFTLGRLTNTRNFGDALAAHVTGGG